MSEKSDDIKQLFSHLGLNPSDYQEIRSAPSSGATMTEAPRRWSLLQAISSPNPVPSRVSPSMAPAPAPAPVPPPQPAAAQWAEILPGLNTTVPRVEAPAAVPPSPPPPPVSEGLSSLFQSVRETPLPAEPAEPPPMTGEQAADRLYRELRSSAQTLAARNPPPPPVTPPWAGYDPDLETRHAALPPTPMPVRVAESPVPSPLPSAVSANIPVAAATTPVRMVIAPSAPDPAPAAMPPPPRPAPVVARTPVATEVRPAMPPPRSVPPAPVASTGLQAAFRRLSEPEPPRVAASGRLRLNYQLPHTSAAGASKDERLGDVLKRISGHNGSTR